MNATASLDTPATRLDTGWTLVLTDAGAYSHPDDVPFETAAVPAIVPGTVAGALTIADRFDPESPEPLFHMDVWYGCSLVDEAPGPATLHFEGLATIAEVFLDGIPILSSRSMFERHDIPVTLGENSRLTICFRALKPHFTKTGPRARWRPRLMSQQGLRLTRTTALGFMPGWCPEIHAAGPWRPIKLTRPEQIEISDLRVFSTLDDTTGLLDVRLRLSTQTQDISLICAGHETTLENEDGLLCGRLRIPGIDAWWPQTHGSPVLHDIFLRINGTTQLVGRTGFRNLTIDHGSDGKDFAVVINGKRIFCRGAVWTSADIVNLPGGRPDYERWLRLAHEAGMNMIRVPGISVYESAAFFDLCDELGILVWQDFMFANFDYPVADEQLMIHVKSEIDRFLAETSAHPSLAILCGGSEIFQQGAMLGLPERIWSTGFCHEVVANLASATRPDLPYVANSPSGGALPFHVNAGIAHYYGVGAYRRPLEDARRANIRFAAECLAFSHLGADEDLAGGKAGIPRDSGADWDFEDIRDHYLQDLYGIDPAAVRSHNSHHYLALSRAVTGEVMEATYAEWRRPGSSCNGALAFTFQDVMKGPGWGVIDASAQPKPAWYALKRAFRPLQLILTDEGTNGLDVHLLNETPGDRSVIVELVCLRDGSTPVVSGQRELLLSAGTHATIAATDLFGAFFDTTYAYRFGPPSHDVTAARLKDALTGEFLADAFHFPTGRRDSIHAAAVEAVLEQEGDGFALLLSTPVFAQSVMIHCPGFQPQDNAFHLAPGMARRIPLRAIAPSGGVPAGTLTSLGNGTAIF